MSSEGVRPADERTRAVEAARERWIERLIDLTRRNNLLYFRDLKTGTLDLSDAPAAARAVFWAGQGVPLGDLVPAADPVRLAASGQDIRRRALANREERGLETLYVAAGIATWNSPDDGRPPASPVLLVPVVLEPRGRDGRVVLRCAEEGDPQLNLVLLHALEAEHGVEIDADAVLATLPADPAPFDPAPVFDALARAARGVPGFTVAPRLVLGNFSFQKMAMVNDLRAHGDTLVSSDLIAALAGDVAARGRVLADRKPVEAAALDETSPDDEFLVLDADSTQQRVIRAVAASQDGVIQGPPGTGKSQTISNLIADLVSRGQRVLFVAEKRAALDVVLKRLDVVGLGHLALDLHGAEITRRDVMRRLAESLTIVRESTPVDAAEAHRRFVDRRGKLNEHVRRLHEPRPPGNRSVYALSGTLLRSAPTPTPLPTRWRGGALDRLDLAAVSRVRDLLTEAAGFGGLFLRNDPSPWTGAALTSGALVQDALDLAARVAARDWPAFETAVKGAARAAGVPEPGTAGAALTLLTLSMEAGRLLETYEPPVFGLDLETLLADLAPAGRGALIRFLAGLFNGRYRSALARMSQVRKTRTASPATLRAETESLRNLLAAWRRDVSPAAPPAGAKANGPGPENAAAIADTMRKDLDALAARLGRDVSAIPFAAAGSLWNALAADTTTPHRLPKLLEIEAALRADGMDELVGEIRRTLPDPAAWPRLFEDAWTASSLDRARSEDSGVSGFNGRTQDQVVFEFCRLDRERLRTSVGRVRRAHAERAVRAMNEHPDQDALVRREAAKKARHLPLRTLLAQAPDVLTALRPCWMASPLTVSQLLDGRRYFDVVLFDEASQILPEDAIPSLMRAARAVVAGDRNQLPPTIFFMAGDDDEDVATDAPEEGFESLLDLMSSFLEPWSLDWHYRSRDESLIAFSNEHIYGERLVTFPGPGGPPVLSHVLVDATPANDAASSESSAAEVRRVVELVLDHAARRPGETLGVIAMGIPHARRVEEAIEEALRERQDLAPFFDAAREDRFFVKNLERVQGDERDAILLTVGYGKDRSGKLPYRFGPLLMKGGERRLNVAITRARKRLTLVSSFSHLDMTPGRSQARGVELLRQYLEYAAQGGHRGSPVDGSPRELDGYQRSVLETLTARGLRLEPLWGASRQRIDFAVHHPDDAARFVLAIECDGPAYAASPTARDRDRLRRQNLEGLGWRFHRIWSLDWFMRRDEEVERCLAALRDALAAGGNENAAAATPASAGQAPARGRRPSIPRREEIDDYTLREIDSLLAWVESDGRLRTDEEIVDEMTEALGFRRRGSRIEQVIEDALRRRRGGAEGSRA